jgi:hypothetical protein
MYGEHFEDLSHMLVFQHLFDTYRIACCTFWKSRLLKATRVKLKLLNCRYISCSRQRKEGRCVDWVTEGGVSRVLGSLCSP